MDLDVARDVAGAGQEAGVVPAERVELGGDGRDVDELPDLDLGAEGQPVAGQGHAHRGLEGAEVRVEVVPLIPDQHELAGLVGGDQERRAELPQQRGEVGRVDRPQGGRILHLGAVKVQRRCGGGTRCRHGFYLPLKKGPMCVIQRATATVGLAHHESIQRKSHRPVLDPSSWSALQGTWLSPAARRPGAGAVRALLRAAFTLRFAANRFRGSVASPGHTGTTLAAMGSCSRLPVSVFLSRSPPARPRPRRGSG